jgi:hypothetical protein
MQVADAGNVATDAGGQSFLERLGFGISEAEQNRINSQISDFDRQIRGPIELFAEALEIKDAVAVPLFITGTGLALIGSGLAITGAAVTGGSVATGPGAGLLAPAGLFITANGVAITTIGGSIAFDTINRTFGTSLPTIPQLRRGP